MSARETLPRVVRLGGSLLEDPRVKDRLRTWLALQPPAPTVLVVGGGPWVEAIRTAFALHGLTEEAAHWLSVRAMGLTARLALELWPEATLLTELAEAQAWRRLDAPAIFDVQHTLTADAASSAPALPQNWSVTSDSIAALVARALGASELVLLKSALPAPLFDFASAAEQGYVDAYFPVAARELSSVRCIDLRGDAFPERVLRCRESPSV
ncbi:MAG: hypothetical protein U0836_15310 [Pirellulales bacterium]